MDENNMVNFIKETEFIYKDTMAHSVISESNKIKNGSKFIVGGELSRLELTLHQHFNWFQKLMWNLCFGVKVEDYNEE